MKKFFFGLICGTGLMMATPLINYPNFSSTAGLNLQGSAVQSGSVLQLTPPNFNQAGSAWFSSSVNVAAGFDTIFSYTIDQGSGSPADGIAFVIQTQGNTALGGNGGGLGAANITGAVAVALRTYVFQDGEIDACGPSNSLIIGSCVVTSSSHSFAGTHTVEVTYTPGLMNVLFDGSPLLSGSINLTSALNLIGGTNAFVGFTGGTGGQYERQLINAWNFTPTPEPATFTLGGLAAAGLFVAARIRARRAS